MRHNHLAAAMSLLMGAAVLAGCTTPNPGPSSNSSGSTAPGRVAVNTPRPDATPSLTVRGASFQDGGIGHSIKVIEFLNDLPLTPETSTSLGASLQGGSVVALHLSGTAGSVIATYLYDTSFQLQCAGMAQPVAPVTSVFTADLTADGYTAWANPLHGQSADGWLAYVVVGIKNPLGCSVIYSRNDQKALDGSNIPAFTTTIPLN